jgi:transposase
MKSSNKVFCSVGRLCSNRSCARVIDAFVERLLMSELGFERAQAAETRRPGYEPRDLLKLCLYGSLNQITQRQRPDSS